MQLARRFHNEAVAQTRRARGAARSCALLRLAGHAPEPRTLELDDAWPETLGRPGTRAARWRALRRAETRPGAPAATDYD